MHDGWEETRWWRVSYRDLEKDKLIIWSETSDEREARRDLMTVPAPYKGSLWKLYQRTERNWRMVEG